MKRLKLLSIICATILLASCKISVPVAQETGKADVAYLLFIRSKSDNKKVTVALTNPQKVFTAETVKSKTANRKGRQYQVSTGTRDLTVTDESGNVIYQTKVFLQGQEVKEINL